MFCRHCGTQLPESARFCPNCCAPTSEIYDMRINVPTIQRGTPLSTQKHSNSHSIGMIVLLLILCSFLMIGVPMAMIGVIGISLYDEYGELTYDLTVNVSADKYNDYSKTVYHPGSGTNYIHHYLPSGKYTVTANKWNALMEVANAFIIIPDNEITEYDGVLTYVGGGFTGVQTHSIKYSDSSIQITIQPGEHIFVMSGDYVFQRIVENSSK